MIGVSGFPVLFLSRRMYGTKCSVSSFPQGFEGVGGTVCRLFRNAAIRGAEPFNSVGTSPQDLVPVNYLHLLAFPTLPKRSHNPEVRSPNPPPVVCFLR